MKTNEMTLLLNALVISLLFATSAQAQELTSATVAVTPQTTASVETAPTPAYKRLEVATDQTTGPAFAIVKTVKTDEGVSITLSNHLAYIDLREGVSSQTAALDDDAYVHYRGWITSNGKPIDDSRVWRVLPSPACVTLGSYKFLKGFEQGIFGMRVGGKRRIDIPADLAYGAKGVPPEIPPNADLTFECELVRLKRGDDWITSISLHEQGYH